jgi:hypothetical protein
MIYANIYFVIRKKLWSKRCMLLVLLDDVFDNFIQLNRENMNFTLYLLSKL